MPDYRDAKTWDIEFQVADPAASLACRGMGLRVQDEADGARSVFVSLPFTEHLLLRMHRRGARIHAVGGNVVPCFTRVRHGTLQLSNMASRLVARGESLGIRSAVAIQQMHGQSYPLDNIFDEFHELEPSSIYEVKDGELIFAGTHVRPERTAHPDDALAAIHRQFDEISRKGQPLCVLLSGGYDSRLNLALALHYASKHGNRVLAFHEFKDTAEAEIARRVASVAGVPLTEKSRTDFLREGRGARVDRDFILLQSGMYRENLIRWQSYLDWIKTEVPDGQIIGLGAEAHKGKWYGTVRRLPRDAEITFGLSTSLVKHLAERLQIERIDLETQARFFAETSRQCAEFERQEAKVDYIHYVSYVAFGFGRRGHSLMQLYNIAFPFLNDEFLKLVFSLEPRDKEAFRLVIRAIEGLAPRLAEIPYTSANQKATLGEQYGLKDEVLNWAAGMSRPVRDALLGVRPRDRDGITSTERLVIDALTPLSEVTSTLRRLILGELGSIPRIRREYVIQLLLYLGTLEKDYDVHLEWR